MRLSLRSYPAREDTHVHGFHQMVLPVDGMMDIAVGNAGGSISREQGVMIACGAQHVFRPRGVNRFIVLDIPREKFPTLTLQSPFFGIDQTFADLTRYAGSELLTGALGLEGEFHLAALIIRKLRRSLITCARPSGPIERALVIMRAHRGEQLTMTELAKTVGLGVSRFYEVFRAQTGRTPAEVLTQIRLDYAEELLGQTTLPIAEIALLAGYSEQSALTRSLRKRRGTTPHAFRETNHQFYDTAT
jgi:AraC-like DNA-binding protein